MEAGEVSILREERGAQLSQPAMRRPAELSEDAKTVWFALAMYAGSPCRS